jgi:transposase
MGGMVPRKVKEQVLDLWVQGLPRQQIAKKTGVGEGTVTGIVDEARSEGFRDKDLSN